MATLVKAFELIEESHGRNVLNMIIVGGYLRKLLDNTRVTRFLGSTTGNRGGVAESCNVEEPE